MQTRLRVFVVVALVLLTSCTTVPTVESASYTQTQLPDETASQGSGDITSIFPPIEEWDSFKLPVFVDPARNNDSTALSPNGKQNIQTVWDLFRNNLSLAYNPDSPRIHKELKRYTQHPEYLHKVTRRAEPYLYHITRSLQKASLPVELVALPIVESAYIASATSRHGAGGLWQFIRSTAGKYGLKRNWWYDGRRDPLAATEAAISYLKQLNHEFHGDWLLALAAYNAGETTIHRALERNRRKGLPEDYWHLRLPGETMRYVPRFLAVVSILENPEIYGIKLHPIHPSSYFETITVSGRTSLVRLAKSLNIAPDLVLKMNAGLLRGITPPGKTSRVLLPIESAARYQAIKAEIADKIEVASLTHRVRRGETLSHIARHYGIPIIRIKASNKLHGDLIRPGQKLQIPDS